MSKGVESLYKQFANRIDKTDSIRYHTVPVGFMMGGVTKIDVIIFFMYLSLSVNLASSAGRRINLNLHNDSKRTMLYKK